MARYKKKQAIVPKPNIINKTTASNTNVKVTKVNTQNATQMRASFALAQVTKQTQQLDEKAQKEFKSYVQALPAMVQMNGLGQAIAFCRSHYTTNDISKTGAKAYQALYNTLQEWLCNSEFSVYSQGDDLLTAIVNNNMEKYRLAQSELQHLLTWLKKMALALIEVKSDKKSDASQGV